MKLNKMREQMAQAFIGSLKEDKIPWHKEWSVIGIKPFNGLSDTHYRGINAMWLSYVAEDKGYDDPRWYTFKQAQEQGFQVKKGEKGTHIEFWSLYDTETKKRITQTEAKELSVSLSQEEYFNRVKPISNTYVVFNAVQIDGVPEIDIEKYQLNTEELISCRDKLITNMEVGFNEGGDRASYSPVLDRIAMPQIERFESEYAYMSTLLHEAAHASGASTRLNRDLTGVFGSQEYAKEELRAEIASAFTAQMTGIQYKQNDNMENHKAYVQSWISILENNPNELFAAIKEAETISDYLIEKGEFDVPKIKLEKEIDNGIDAEINSYVREHKKMLSEMNVEKTPIVINAYGGPGAGKSTACMDICSELKKLGYNAEYVQEYAKDLVYEKNFEMLNGTAKNQFEVLKEQTRRLDRLYNKVEFIVTDAPVLLNTVYNRELTANYSKAINELYKQYTNFSFFVERDASHFQEEGRIHNLEESIQKDNEIKNLLKDNDVYYGKYNHDTVQKVVKNSITTYNRINKDVEEKREVQPNEGYKSVQEQVIDKVELLKQAFIDETKETIADWQIGQISREQIVEMLSKGKTSELELAINELGEAGLGSSEKLRLEALDSVREFYASRIVVKNAEKSIDYFPDPNVSMDDMYNYGYTYDGMLPVSREKAIELLQNNGIEIFKLYPDNTEVSMEGSRIENDNEEVMYGIEKEAWERHLDRVKDFEKVQDIAFAENILKLPENERITEWFGEHNMYETKLNVSSEQIKSKYDEYSKMVEAYKKIQGVEISNFAIDEDKYVHFTAKAGDYEYDGLYCIHDPANGPDNKIVSIDYGFEDKIFEQQWENIESFLKAYSQPIYSEIQKHEINLFQGADSARLRMALKGNQTSKDTYFNSEKINESVKQLAFDVGTEAMEYIDAGMDIKDVVAYKSKAIDKKLQIDDLAYTKNILCSVFARTNQDYRELMNNITIVDKDNMLLISEGLASRIIESNTPVYAVENGELNPITSRLEFENMHTKDYWIGKEQFSNLPEDIKPVIKCEWSEHETFDEGKIYTAYEFNSIMEKEDREFVEAKTKALEKYDSWDDAYENGTPEDRRFLGYRKVKFEVDLGDGRKIVERQDIGDGDGSTIEFLGKVLSNKNVAEELKQSITKEEKFISYIDKVKVVYNYEQANNIPEDFRVTTADMSCLSKNMLETQYELISNIKLRDTENIINNTKTRTPNAMKKLDLNFGR